VIRRWTGAVLLAGGLLGAAGCSALLDWNDFSGGLGDGGSKDGSGADGTVEGSAGDTGTDAPADTTPTSCGTAMQCTASAPAGWTGPVELYVAPVAQGAPPSCGSGFNATPVFDGNAVLTAPPATCSACSCGAVTGESCDGPVMTFFFDSSCQSAAGTQTVTSSCQPTTIAQSVTVAAPVASGGMCATTGGVATTTPLTWGNVARACAPTSTVVGGCPAGQVCGQAPASPFSSGACVMQAGIATACPPAYPTGPQVFYAGVDDPRTCSACQCGAPTGAQCTIGSPAINNCIGGSLNAPNACVAFTGPSPVTLVPTAMLTLADAGACTATAGGGTATGTATPSSPTSFCCSP
jgi:hypothetical protein